MPQPASTLSSTVSGPAATYAATPTPSSCPALQTAPSYSSYPSYSPSPSADPSTPLDPPALHAHGLELFRTIFSLVFTIFQSLAGFYQAHPEHNRISIVCLAVECFASLIALEFTLHAAPERVTPRQLLRLAKAARALTRLTGQTFDFTPWTTLSPNDWTQLDRLYPPPINPDVVPQLRPYELRLPPSGERSAALCLYPGATLANVIKKLARILPPDYDPTAFQDAENTPEIPSMSANDLTLTHPTSTDPVTGIPSQETQDSPSSAFSDALASDSSPVVPSSASCLSLSLPIPP